MLLKYIWRILFHGKLGLLLLAVAMLMGCQAQQKAKAQAEQQLQPSNEQIGEYVIGIFEDSKSHLWFGTLSKGVARYDGKQLKYFTTEDGLKGNRIGSFVEDANGNLWMSTGVGIAKYNGKTFESYTEQDGLCDNQVSNLLMDSSGTLWIGSLSGVCQFDGSNFIEFPIPDPAITPPYYQETSNWLTEIFEDSKGNIWFGRDGFGACKYDGQTFTHFSEADGLAANTVRDIQEDAQGNFWFGSRIEAQDHPDPEYRAGPGGLVKYDGNAFFDFPNLAGLHSSDVYDIYRDSKDNLWVGTRKDGIYKYDGKQFTNYTDESGVSGFPKSVTNLLEDRNGNIWIGCAGGLFRLNDSGIVNVTTQGPWE